MRRHLRSSVLLASAVAVALVLTSCGGSNGDSDDGDSDDLPTLSIAYTSESFNFLPLYVAIDEGYFAKHGVDVEATSLASSDRSMAALIGGSVDVTLGAPGATINARLRGEQIEIIGGIVNAAMYTLVGAEGVNTLEDLKGRRIGVAGRATGDTLLLLDLLEAGGVNPDDVQLVEVGGTPERLAALESGAADAGMLLSPQNYQAQQLGLSVVVQAYDLINEFQHTGINALIDIPEEKVPAVERMFLALSDAVKAIKSDEQMAIDIAVERLEISPELAKIAYDDYMRANAFPDDLSYSLPGIETVVDQLVNAELVEAEQVSDISQFVNDKYFTAAANQG